MMNENVTLTKKSKSSNIVIVLLLITILAMGFFIYLKKDVIFNTKAGEENNAEKIIDNPSSNKDNVEKEIKLTKKEKDDISNMVFILNEIVCEECYYFDKEYMKDDNFSYAFVWYLALSDLKWLEIDINGEKTTGGVSFWYDSFAEYYKEQSDKDLNINNLDKNSKFLSACEYPNVQEKTNDSIFDMNGKYIFGSYYTGFLESMMHLKLKKLMYNESDQIYTIEMEYYNNVDENKEENLGTAKLKYTMDNFGNKKYKSFMINKA